ncbi:hypothetical protein KAR34_13605 [bacterium]|nr:hypothetical protein [bacterium]
MPDNTIYYRIYFNELSATREQLDRILAITVTQEMDAAWEAQIKIPLCLNEQGDWSDEDEAFFESFTRIRIEIKADGENWVPLIDGPVVGNDTNMQHEPGQSEMTLMVHDDSVYLNRESVDEEVGERTDKEIIEYLFSLADAITETDVVDLPNRRENRRRERNIDGMAIRLIRTLARQYQKHAYVLPGEERGQSIGCFKDFPTEVDEDLPMMIAIGEERNVNGFQAQQNAQQPATYVADSISLDDKGITSATSGFREADLMGSQEPYPDESQTGTRRVSQYADEDIDTQEAVQGQSNASLYAYTGSGSVIGACYKGVLRPFKMVTIRAGRTQLSGNYVISKVVHQLGQDDYTQEFSVVRNATSDAEQNESSMITSII